MATQRRARELAVAVLVARGTLVPGPRLGQRQPFDIGGAGRAEHDQQPLGEASSGGGAAFVFLGHQIHRTQLESTNGGDGAGSDMGADDHDRAGATRP